MLNVTYDARHDHECPWIVWHIQRSDEYDIWTALDSFTSKPAALAYLARLAAAPNPFAHIFGR